MDSAVLELKCLDLANNLLTKYTTSSNRVRNVRDINSDLIVLLFERITKHSIPDLLANETNEAEAHNVQAVIDTLSLDLLGISLSHITGEDVVAGNVVAVYNLLEVMEGLATYLKSKNQAKRQNCVTKRKINRKKKSSSSSAQSLKSLLQDSPDIEAITQIDCTVKRKINRREKSSSSTSIKSLASFHQSSSDDANVQGKKKSDILSSMSLASLPKDIESQSSGTSKSKSEYPKSFQSGSRTHSSTSEIYPTQESVNNRIRISPPSQSLHKESNLDVRPNLHIHNEDIDLQASADDKSSRIPLPFQIDSATTQKNNVPAKEMTGFSERNIKRKISRRLRGKIPENSSKPSQEVEELYEKNFENRIRGLLQKNSCKSRASYTKNMHLQSLRKPLKRSPISACKKSFLLPHSLRRRSIAHKAVKRKVSQKSNTNQNVLEQKENVIPMEMPKEGFIQELFDEFPGLQLTPAIINHITNKYQQHLLMMHKQVKEILLKKPKSQRQAEEAAKKQSLLDNILKKDIRQQKYLVEYKEHKKFENKIKYQLRDARLQSAKMKQYCDEFRTEMRKKVQKRNFSEELVLENLFKESLKMQKEQVDSLCQEVKETGEDDARQHLIYLDALENLYQTQFSLLSESFAAEKKDVHVRAMAEKQEMNTMQREFQDELKQEIRFMQQVIVDCMEDIHFREMDAERFKAKLQRRQ